MSRSFLRHAVVIFDSSSERLHQMRAAAAAQRATCRLFSALCLFIFYALIFSVTITRIRALLCHVRLRTRARRHATDYCRLLLLLFDATLIDIAMPRLCRHLNRLVDIVTRCGTGIQCSPRNAS